VKILKPHTSVSHKLLTLTILIVVSLSCSKESGEQDSPQNEVINLQTNHTYSLAIKEPSGLCKAWNKNEFLIVSDHSNTVFRINDKGEILQEYPFVGSDLEGISYQEKGKIIWLVDEQQNKLIKLNKEGELLLDYKLSYQSHPSNKGLEGIAVNTNNNHIFMLNEASPGLLLEFFDGEIIRSISLGFAPDYSGLFFDAKNNQLWITSDEAKRIYQCNIDGKLLKTFQHTVNKAEGIIVNVETLEFWICSDSKDKLYMLSTQ